MPRRETVSPRTIEVDRFTTRTQDVVSRNHFYPDVCPTVRVREVERIMEMTREKIREYSRKGEMYVGPVGLSREAARKLTRDELDDLLLFHALQRSVQVLSGASLTDPAFRQGLQNGPARIDAVRIDYVSSRSGKFEKQGWFRSQKDLARQFAKKHKRWIDYIHEHFDIIYDEPILENDETMYRVPSEEQFCCHIWYAIRLVPREESPLSESEKIGGKKPFEQLVTQWKEIKAVVEKDGDEMPDPPLSSEQIADTFGVQGESFDDDTDEEGGRRHHHQHQHTHEHRHIHEHGDEE